jgi:hypothetical protein
MNKKVHYLVRESLCFQDHILNLVSPGEEECCVLYGRKQKGRSKLPPKVVYKSFSLFMIALPKYLLKGTLASTIGLRVRFLTYKCQFCFIQTMIVTLWMNVLDRLTSVSLGLFFLHLHVSHNFCNNSALYYAPGKTR